LRRGAENEPRVVPDLIIPCLRRDRGKDIAGFGRAPPAVLWLVAVKLQNLTTMSLHLAGWEFEGSLPDEKKYVCLAVPHTSNWDGLILVAVLQSLGLEMAWMIKGSWVDGPLGPALRRLGAVAIDRSRKSNVVQQMIAEFQRREHFALGIPPEGTRARAEYWKSGFYHIARGAQVPVVPGYIDYERKRAGLGPAIRLTGDVRADMDRIRAFYAGKKPIAFAPESFGPIRLLEESAG
jgi:1-acyl-sn-glycerol-3-phosphate acyltransferase